MFSLCHRSVTKSHQFSAVPVNGTVLLWSHLPCRFHVPITFHERSSESLQKSCMHGFLWQESCGFVFFSFLFFHLLSSVLFRGVCKSTCKGKHFSSWPRESGPAMQFWVISSSCTEESLHMLILMPKLCPGGVNVWHSQDAEPAVLYG